MAGHATEVKLESFQSIYRRACERKGGEKVLEAMLQAPLSKAQIEAISDDRFLAAMTKKVFQSGFVWRVIEQKWPDFETLFWSFLHRLTASKIVLGIFLLVAMQQVITATNGRKCFQPMRTVSLKRMESSIVTRAKRS